MRLESGDYIFVVGEGIVETKARGVLGPYQLSLPYQYSTTRMITDTLQFIPSNKLASYRIYESTAQAAVQLSFKPTIDNMESFVDIAIYNIYK